MICATSLFSWCKGVNIDSSVWRSVAPVCGARSHQCVALGHTSLFPWLFIRLHIIDYHVISLQISMAESN